MPSIRTYFSTNPSAPVVILVAWALSLLGGLVVEKNKREAMIEKLENHKGVLTTLIARAKDGEQLDIDRELTIVNEQSKSFEQVLQDLEKEDEQWTSEVVKLDSVPAAPASPKKRKDVDQKFV
ncbi:hypothetical protein TRVA0_013S02058 [Trichomonascus vanleenenianus]|uniref:uncharacterized protein n=1 Tax=Trichomonascus vanleenenianus TaxID=2268995 RepID=UPI003ECAAF23